jgi:hypothetical protein
MAKNNHKVSGTCQACFGVFALKGDKLVHHGYLRPGDGCIHGDCCGVNHLPYELDVDVTKRWRSRLANELRPYLEKQIVEAPTWVTITITVPDYSQRVRRGYAQKLVDLNVGEEYYGTTFKSAVNRRIQALKAELSQVIDSVVELDQRIARWVYAPEKLVRTERQVGVVHGPGSRPGDALCRRASRNSRAGLNTCADRAYVTCPKCLALVAKRAG